MAILDGIVVNNTTYDLRDAEATRMIMLQEENIPGTVQTITFDDDGNISQIVHSDNDVTVRTDVFSFGAITITEVRTLSSGENLTIVTDTDTLETTTTYSAS